jgi:hypothetical protein
LSGDLIAGLGVGTFAVLLGVAGIVAAIRRHQRRASIAATYGQTGGIAYTIVQAGCSGVLLLGGLGLLMLVLLIGR